MQEKHPSLVQFGKTIRIQREAKGLSQEAFAAKAGINRTYCGDIERGEYAITLLMLFKLAAALDVDARTLIHEAQQMFREEGGRN